MEGADNASDTLHSSVHLATCPAMGDGDFFGFGAADIHTNQTARSAVCCVADRHIRSAFIQRSVPQDADCTSHAIGSTFHCALYEYIFNMTAHACGFVATVSADDSAGLKRLAGAAVNFSVGEVGVMDFAIQYSDKSSVLSAVTFEIANGAVVSVEINGRAIGDFNPLAHARHVNVLCHGEILKGGGEL